MTIIHFLLDLFHLVWKLAFGHENCESNLMLYLKFE